MEADYDTMDLRVYCGDIDLVDDAEPREEDKSDLADLAWS